MKIATRKDFDVSYFKGSGAGGQNRQKNATGVQIIHRASGAMGRCSETRSLAENKDRAFRRLAASAKMRLYISLRLFEERNKETLEQAVDRSMSPENLKIEIRHGDRWMEWK